MGWIIVVIILGISLIILLSYTLTLKMRDKAQANKVIKMSLQRKQAAQTKQPSKVSKQICSFCRKKEKKLSFYSDEQGRIVGVCRQCRPQAERRALMRL